MDNPIAIEFRDVSKKFRIYHERKNAIFDHITKIGNNNHYEEYRVLDNVSFEINKGEMFGIIGRNGSGKTTLLRLMANIFRPESGIITTNGTVVPILELGTGFQGDLTARDNIIQYGIILGFTRKDIIGRIEKILEFAELERFADTKIRNFSSGMIARLAFSTAIQVEPDILLVDEILAVGDLSFREKSYKAFLSFKERRKTIIYVSHDIDTVKKLCDRVILLEKGKIVSMGNAEKVVEDYLSILNS
jgi:lipopolysaccharide transport system ATP-binding protein